MGASVRRKRGTGRSKPGASASATWGGRSGTIGAGDGRGRRGMGRKKGGASAAAAAAGLGASATAGCRQFFRDPNSVSLPLELHLNLLRQIRRFFPLLLQKRRGLLFVGMLCDGFSHFRRHASSGRGGHDGKGQRTAKRRGTGGEEEREKGRLKPRLMKRRLMNDRRLARRAVLNS